MKPNWTWEPLKKRLYKPTADEKATIRSCAQRSAGCKGIEINPSTRTNLTTNATHFNIAIISDDPRGNDTDLSDNAYRWSDFVKGFELTPDGRGVFDFWVYSLGYWAELKTNVTIFVEGGRLVRVEGTGAKKPLWQI